MGNKEIQKERMRGYFIEAAKKLLLHGSAKDLSVRKIAGEAGYSYATLYNYFENLDHLLWYVIIDVFNELSGILENVDRGHLMSDRDKLDKTAIVYVDYFLENPNIFRLVFIAPPQTMPQDVAEKLRQPSLQHTVEKAIEAASGGDGRTEILGASLTAALHGYLMFSILLGQYTRDDLHVLIKESISLHMKEY